MAGIRQGSPPPSIPSIFPPHLSAAAFPPALPQEGNTFLISFRPLVRTRCPFPPSLRPCFSEVSLHFPPETPRPSISLLRGKREISSSRIESPQLPPPLARRPVPVSVPGRRAWEEAARAWAPKKTNWGSLCPPLGPAYLGLVARRMESGVRRRAGWISRSQELFSLRFPAGHLDYTHPKFPFWPWSRMQHFQHPNPPGS